MYTHTDRAAGAHIRTHSQPRCTRSPTHTHTHWLLWMWVTGPCSPSSVRKQFQSLLCSPIASARSKHLLRTTGAVLLHIKKDPLPWNTQRKPLPSPVIVHCLRVLLSLTLHRGGGGQEDSGMGEKQEAYFILRRTVMRNGDSRVHYFASTVAAAKREGEMTPRV